MRLTKSSCLLTGLLTFSALACSQPPVGAAPSLAVATREPTPIAASGRSESGPKSPIEATLTGPDAVLGSATIDLKLKVSRANSEVGPIKVLLKLPVGVKLESGTVDEALADATALSFERTWRIGFGAVPRDDVTVVVDWQTKAAGFHAELPYRFGRPAPKEKEPPRLPEVRLPSGQSLGRPILTPDDPKP